MRTKNRVEPRHNDPRYNMQSSDRMISYVFVDSFLLWYTKMMLCFGLFTHFILLVGLRTSSLARACEKRKKEILASEASVACHIRAHFARSSALENFTGEPVRRLPPCDSSLSFSLFDSFYPGKTIFLVILQQYRYIYIDRSGVSI